MTQPDRTGPRRAFRPRASRVVCLVLLVGTIAGAGVILRLLGELDLLPSTESISVVVVALILVVFLLRVVTIRAIPGANSLMVRNIVLTHDVPWEQILAVHLGERSWASLDLADGTTLSVMAIQRSDGDYGRKEAGRLAALVAIREAGEGGGPDPGDTGRQE